MLFKEQLGALSPFDYHALRKIREKGIHWVTLELKHMDYTTDELQDMLKITQVTPVAVRLPQMFHLGLQAVDLENLFRLLDTLAQAFQDPRPFIVLETKAVALGEIFEYFETKPGDFKALYDFKEVWVENIIQTCALIKPVADKHNLQLLIENVPMGGPCYFEPGQAKIYPALRTPRHLKQIAEKTGIGLCFHTGHARISTNVLQYMKRSRSVFAAATEEEILTAPADWLEFYEEIRDHVQLIHLCDSLSWGDTPGSNNIPFRSDHIQELLKFAERLGDDLPPIVLHLRENEDDPLQGTYLEQMLQILKELKTG
ncbi:hypothetical protein GCM10010965_09600 [Caldalkalibacillus thermarum]|uniref:hypothetical protein n=1 Tax=Caldalkalibacillus thermarum TaxID=296745 RepID=UPI0016678EEE|nr:hypothetical protein [Caldalkalibacillus thermarum]GGK18668.1 hypothetical protein GCM10010965_09600 [Caldalkalibacillus thermarum]